MNNFEQLEEQTLNQVKGPPPSVHKRIMGTIKSFALITDLVELYIPTVLNIVISALGGDPKKKELKNKYPNKEQ